MTGVQTCALPICFPVTILFPSHDITGLDDGLANEGVSAGDATLLGLKLAKEGK